MRNPPPATCDAAIMSDTGERLSFGTLERRSIQLANFLRETGLCRGDRVAIVLENRLDWLVAMWGVRRAEMFYVPVNWHLTAGEVRYVVENSDARVLISSSALLDLAHKASAGIATIRARLSIGGAEEGFADFDLTLDAQSDVAPADERDGGSMPYSSGTTGAPKGILRALPDAPFATPIGLEAFLAESYGIDRDAIYLGPAPMYHSAPTAFTNTMLVQGATIVLMPSFDAEAMLAAIERYRVTHVQCVPTHFVRLLRLPVEVRSRHDLSSLKVLIHAAAPCAPDVKRAMIEWLGPIVHEYYAGSERCGMTLIDSREWLAHPGSVGRSRSPIHIRDMDTGAELPPGEIGTIWFENPVPFDYHKDSDKTAATFSPEGWGTHGDVGSMDADGYLYLADRRSDLILSGGVNIYPQEIENVLATHPAVADVAVIGVPNAEFGQEVKAVVQPLPGIAVTEAEIIAFARQHLAGFKAPRSVEFTDALPRLPSGKLLRRRLIEDRQPAKEPA